MSGGGILLAPIVIYYLPWMVAEGRRHRNRGFILFLNAALGWTLLGWIVALIWAATGVLRVEEDAAVFATRSDPVTLCADCGAPISESSHDCNARRAAA
jgi:hypothetical protein